MYEWFTDEFKALRLLTALHNFSLPKGSLLLWEVENWTDGKTHVICWFTVERDVLTEDEVKEVAGMRTAEEILTWLRKWETSID